MELITREVTLPHVPDNLIPTPNEIELLPSVKYDRTHVGLKYVGSELQEWLNHTFNGNTTGTFIILGDPYRRGLSPHKDIGGRLYGYNYIIDTGGSCVPTTIYDENLNVVQQEHLLPHVWYKLPTQEWHSVHGILPGLTRILISVNYKAEVGPPGKFYHNQFECDAWVKQANNKVYQQLDIQKLNL